MWHSCSVKIDPKQENIQVQAAPIYFKSYNLLKYMCNVNYVSNQHRIQENKDLPVRLMALESQYKLERPLLTYRKHYNNDKTKNTIINSSLTIAR